MKILLMILLVSCGKHTQPPRTDYPTKKVDHYLPKTLEDVAEDSNIGPESESDYLESRNIQDITGTMDFVAGHPVSKVYKISVSSKASDRHLKTLELMTFNQRLIPQMNYFNDADWFQIYIKDSFDIKLFGQEQFFQVRLHLNNFSTEENEILLIDPYKQTLITPDVQDISLSLSQSELANILQGRSRIIIRQKDFLKHSLYRNSSSYRVFYSDVNTSKVFYINPQFPIDDFLKSKGFQKSIAISMDLTTVPYSGYNKQLWKRQINNDWIITYASIDELRSVFISSFKKINHHVNRTNGISKSVLRLTKKVGSKSFLLLKNIKYSIPALTKKKTLEKVLISRHIAIKCEKEITKPGKTVLKSMSFDNLIKELFIRLDGKTVALIDSSAIKLQKTIEDKKEALKIILPLGVKDVEIYLRSFPKNKMVVKEKPLGVCAKFCPVLYLIPETELSFIAESYIENI